MAWDGLSFLNCRALLPVSFLPNLPHPSHEQGGPQNKLLPPSTPPTLLWSRGKNEPEFEKPWSRSARTLGLPFFGVGASGDQ